MTSAFTGLLAYPVTPLHGDDSVDLDALGHVVDRAVDAGVDGVTVLASSGAGTSFDDKERDAVVRVALDAAGGRASLYAGVAGESVRGVVGRARAAVDAGAQGVVLPPFSYLPLDDAEVRALCSEVAAAVPGTPVCFYNKPVQLGYDVSPETLARLASDGSVVAIKDPAATAARPAGRVGALRAAAGPGLVVGLSGDVALVGSAELADAWHTGLAAIAPAEYVAVRRARTARQGGADADDVQAWLLALARAVAATGRPIAAIHRLASLTGIPTAPPRDSLVPLTDADRDALAAVVALRP